MAKDHKVINFIDWFTDPRTVGSILASGVVLISSVALLSSGIKDIKEDNKKEESKQTATLINNEIFEEVYGDYEEYISLIAKAIQDSDMNNSSMEAYVAYQNMQDKGWISYGTEFEREVSLVEPTGNLGVLVPAGQGVCRNVAFNLFKVLDKLGYDAGVVYGKTYVENEAPDDTYHALTYVHEGNHLFLYDPMNKTIFLRDVLGRFISIDDERYTFTPLMFLDQEANVLADNEVYLFLGEDYGSYVTYITRRKKAQDKVDKLGYYYLIYEIQYLKDYEKSIVDSLDSYSEEVNRILKEHGEEAVELKFN